MYGLQNNRYMNFRRRAGAVIRAAPLWAEVAPSARSLRGMSAAQKAGLRYEEKTIDFLYGNFTGFVDHLPFKFYASDDAGRAIPDGIIFDSTTQEATIVEIKYRHSREAYYQLVEFYLPIVKVALPGYKLSLLEICKNYDPGVVLPGQFNLTNNINHLVKSGETYNIYIHSGR